MLIAKTKESIALMRKWPYGRSVRVPSVALTVHLMPDLMLPAKV